MDEEKNNNNIATPIDSKEKKKKKKKLEISGIEPEASYMQSTRSTTELYPQHVEQFQWNGTTYVTVNNVRRTAATREAVNARISVTFRSAVVH